MSIEMNKKKQHLLLAGVLLPVLLIAFALFCEIRVSGTAIMNGNTLPEPITIRRFHYYYDDAIIPLVKSCECLGYRCIWESDTVCRIGKGEEEYLLDLSARTLVDTKDRRFEEDPRSMQENYLMCPPGENHGVIQIAEKEVYVSLSVLRGMNMRLGKPYSCKIDFWNRQLMFDLQ